MVVPVGVVEWWLSSSLHCHFVLKRSQVVDDFSIVLLVNLLMVLFLLFFFLFLFSILGLLILFLLLSLLSGLFFLLFEGILFKLLSLFLFIFELILVLINLFFLKTVNVSQESSKLRTDLIHLVTEFIFIIRWEPEKRSNHTKIFADIFEDIFVESTQHQPEVALSGISIAKVSKIFLDSHDRAVLFEVCVGQSILIGKS